MRSACRAQGAGSAFSVEPGAGRWNELESTDKSMKMGTSAYTSILVFRVISHFLLKSGPEVLLNLNEARHGMKCGCVLGWAWLGSVRGPYLLFGPRAHPPTTNLCRKEMEI